VLLAAALPVAALVGWAVLGESPIDPETWTPGPGRLPDGVAAGDGRLGVMDVFPTGGGHGPEDLAVDAQGRVYGGVQDGRILRWGPEGQGPEVFADTHGRPLGLTFAPDGRLLVADGLLGLLAVDPAGHVATLCDHVDGEPLVFADDLALAADGTVYVSDASDRFAQPEWKLDLLEGRPRGRVIRYDLATGASSTVLDHLWFANGLALAPDDAFLLIVETSRYRVRRLWLAGPRAGQDEVIVDDLPSFPDGIDRDAAGRFWIALPTPRKRVLDALGPWPRLRALVPRLPAFLQPGPARYTSLLAIDGDGHGLDVLDNADGGFGFGVVTSTEAAGGWLWLGSLSEPAIARVRAP
jgi:sugar lactone lactonase YvrE